MKLIFLILLINCTTISKPEVKNYIYDDIYNYYINENYNEALKLINNSEVDDYELNLLTASIYFKLNKFEESEYYYLKAYNKNKSEVSALHLVNIYIILNKKKSAIFLLNDLYQNNKLDSIYPFILGVLYKDIKDYNQALDYFNYALNRNYEPKIDIYTNILEISNILGLSEVSNKYKDLLEIANKAIEKKESKEIKKFLDLENLIRQKKYNEAILKIKNLISIKENDFKLHCLLGDIYRLVDEKVLAKDEYDISIKLEPNYFDSHYGLIDLLYSENKLQDAIIEINKSLKIFRDNPELYFYLGKIYEDLFELDKAQVYYKNSLDNYSGNFYFRKLKYADLLLRKNNTESALALYNELIPYFDESEIIERINICKSFQLIKEAKKNFKEGNIDKGISHLKKAIQLNKGLFTEFIYAKKIIELERWTEAEELLNKIFDEYNYYPAIILLKKNNLRINSNKSTDKLNNYNTLLEIAEFYFEDEQFIDAIDYYKKIVNKNNIDYINKKLGFSYLYQSLVEYEKSNYDKYNIYTLEAKKILKKEDLSEKQEFINNRIIHIENEKDFKIAEKFIESDKFEDAINIYKKVNKNINSIFLYNKITNLYIQIGKLFPALEYIESAAINNYKKKEILANLYYLLEKYNRLEEICSEIIHEHPESISCYTLLGKYKLEIDPEEALNYFTLALSIDSNSFQSIIGKGRTLLKLNKYNDSILEFEKAIKLNKSSYEPYFYLGIIAFRERKYNLSENYFKKSLKINSENKETNYYLALIYYNKNNYNKAIDYLEIIKYNKEKYINLYIKNLEKLNSDEITIEKYKLELNKIKLLNNKNDIDKTTINIIPINEKLVFPPIRINNYYLLNFNNSINLYNNKLDKIYWKVNLNFKYEKIEYYNNKIYLISSNHITQLDIETGYQDWELYFQSDNIPKLYFSKNIFTLIRINKYIYNLLKIDKSGKIIDSLELKGEYYLSMDKQGNIYLFQLEKNSLNWEILDEKFETLFSKKSLFSTENRNIEEITIGEDFIIIKRGSTIYKFFHDNKIIIKKYEFPGVLYFKSTNQNNLLKINDKLCLLNFYDLSCEKININIKENILINDYNLYSIKNNSINKIHILKNQSIKYEYLNIKRNSLIRLFEKSN